MVLVLVLDEEEGVKEYFSKRVDDEKLMPLMMTRRRKGRRKGQLN